MSAQQQALPSFPGYTTIALIGSGAYGAVYKAKRTAAADQSSSQQVVVAIKRILFDAIPEEVEDVVKEVAFMSILSHPAIVKYIDSFITPLPTATSTASSAAIAAPPLSAMDSVNAVCVVEEWVNGGSISQLFTRHPHFSEAEIAAVSVDVLSALNHLHDECSLVHRDVKCSNLLLDAAAGAVKLTDFGACGKVEGYTSLRYTLVGTPGWMPPEMTSMLGGEQTDARNLHGANSVASGSRRYSGHGGVGSSPFGGSHTFSTDIWSFGVTVLEMMFGLPPNADFQFSSTILRLSAASSAGLGGAASQPISITPQSLDAQYSTKLKHFIAVCLARNPSQRPSAAVLLSHPFLQAHKGDDARAVLKNLSKQFTHGGDAQRPSMHGAKHSSVSDKAHSRAPSIAVASQSRYNWFLGPSGLATRLDGTALGSSTKDDAHPSLTTPLGSRIQDTALFHRVIPPSLRPVSRASALLEPSPQRLLEDVVRGLRRCERTVPSFTRLFCSSLLGQMESNMTALGAAWRAEHEGQQLSERHRNLHAKPPSPSKFPHPALSRDSVPRLPLRVGMKDAAPQQQQSPAASRIDPTAYLYNVWRNALRQ